MTGEQETELLKKIGVVEFELEGIYKNIKAQEDRQTKINEILSQCAASTDTKYGLQNRIEFLESQIESLNKSIMGIKSDLKSVKLPIDEKVSGQAENVLNEAAEALHTAVDEVIKRKRGRPKKNA